MVRVTGSYFWRQGASFDFDYYATIHMALTRRQLTPHGLTRLESDRFLIDGTPNTGDLIAASHAYFDGIAQARAAMAAAREVLLSDVPKYTTLVPEIKLSIVTTHT